MDDKDAQKIIQIYNYDGPGFPEEMIQHTNYKMIVDKIKNLYQKILFLE
ncbi:Mbeg1-like protein [Coprobacillaceae bacterium CR2/5/TPMF4]|nr:Mbeg1-like protein [Coprobacillaceae bacterium CR2/5/TPMF4]